jgi:type II secretory pathway component GspD/PulD (secretin)
LYGVFEGTAAELQRYVARQDVTLIVVGDGEQPVRVRLGGAPASAALRPVAHQVGGADRELAVIRRDRNTYIIGEPQGDDLIARVYYVSAESAEQMASAIGVLGSAVVESAAVGDVLIVRDVPAGIAAIDALYESVMGARGQYVVEVRVVEVADSAARVLGLDVDVSATLSLSAGDAISSGTGLASGTIAALLQADQDDSSVRLVTAGRVHVIEGQEGLLRVGDTVPVPQRSVSPEGTVQVTGFDRIETGFILPVAVRTEPDGRLRVTIQAEVSDIAGFVEGAPIVTQRSVSSSAVVEPGGLVVLGGFAVNRRTESRRGVPGLDWFAVDDQQARQSRLYVVCRVVVPESLPELEAAHVAAVEAVTATPPATALRRCLVTGRPLPPGRELHRTESDELDELHWRFRLRWSELALAGMPDTEAQRVAALEVFGHPLPQRVAGQGAATSAPPAPVSTQPAAGLIEQQ